MKWDDDLSERSNEAARTFKSRVSVLHNTSTSNLRFNFKSCIWWSSDITAIVPINQGFGGLKT